MKTLSTLLVTGFLALSATVMADHDGHNEYYFHSYKGQYEKNLDHEKNHGKPDWVTARNAYKKGLKDGAKAAKKNHKKSKLHNQAYRQGYELGISQYDDQYRYSSNNYQDNSLYSDFNDSYYSNDNTEYKWRVGTELAAELLRANRAGEQVDINRLIEIPLNNRYRYYE